jgi:glycosyltransferase involved in cell wall biosynthesis
MRPEERIAVVIPCYRVTRHVLEVIERIGPECWRVYVVDDCCPDGSGELVRTQCPDPRVVVLRNAVNLGVGGAVMAGYRRAIEDGATVIVKIDGDGQMAPELLPCFVAPIVAGEADYAKGNRFFDLSQLSRMPGVRLAGNTLLSFMAKLSTGYWHVFDPTNGYTAIDARVADRLPFDRISRRYFFETDVLFRLNALRAVVVDVPMDASYGDEVSNLRISKVVGEFAYKHCANFAKRVFYNYFLRDMSVASFELLLGAAMLLFALVFGTVEWLDYRERGVAAPTGTVMLAALPALLGVQLLLAFLSYDIAAVPRRPLHRSLPEAPARLLEARWPATVPAPSPRGEGAP